jgi:hypothetical protein
MGLADIVVEALESEQVRNAIGENGIRVLNLNNSSQQSASEGENNGGIIKWLWDGAKALVGFLCETIGGALNFTLTSFWSFLHSTAQFIWNFNWNITDKEIETQIQAKWDALGSMLGGTVGNFVGYLGCGVAPGAVIFAFNEPMGAYVLENVTEELAEEFIGNISALIKYTFTAGVSRWARKKSVMLRYINTENASTRWFVYGRTFKGIFDW